MTYGRSPSRTRNTSQGFNFRGIDAAPNAIGPVFRQHGVVVAPHEVLEHPHQTIQSRDGRPMSHVRVQVVYRWYGPAGDHIDTQALGEARPPRKP